jgi:hypothetical protein
LQLLYLAYRIYAEIARHCFEAPQAETARSQDPNEQDLKPIHHPAASTRLKTNDLHERTENGKRLTPLYSNINT